MENTLNSINKPKNTTEIFDSGDEVGMEQIRQIEQETFNWEVTEEDIDKLVEKIKSPTSLTFVLKDGENSIFGYLIAVPASVAADDISGEDTLFEPTEEKLYIETFAISKKHRGSILQVKNLFKNLGEKARELSYKTIAAHIPTEHLPLYERFSDVEVLRKLEDWFGSGEVHLYIEISLQLDP
jgi:hypothetical protein